MEFGILLKFGNLLRGPKNEVGDLSANRETFKKRMHEVIKKIQLDRMCVGEDIKIYQILNSMGNIIVVRFKDQRIYAINRKDLLQKVWSPIFNYGSSFNMLSNGWLTFTFRKDEYVESILEGVWFWGSYLSLKCRQRMFVSNLEKNPKSHVHVKFQLELPFYILTKNFLVNLKRTS